MTNDHQRNVERDFLSPELQALHRQLQADSTAWSHQVPSPDRLINRFHTMVGQEYLAQTGTSDADTPAPRPPMFPKQGHRPMPTPHHRITAFLAVAFTVCLIAASAGVFVVLNHHHATGPSANKISPSPTAHTTPAMPPDLFALAMVSDHEGWAVQGSGFQSLMHFHNGTWQNVSLPGLPTAQSMTLAIASASDGWLIATTPTDSQILYHYDGTTWSQVALPTLPSSAKTYLTTISLGANGDDWLAGGYSTSGSQMLTEHRLMPDSSPGACCGTPLLLHLVGGKWTQVTVPAGINITAESVSMGWFLGNASDPDALYHYQNGSWSRVPLGITDSLQSLAMVSPTSGWIGVTTASPTSGGNITSNTWIIYHFDGKTVQHIAQTTYQHCHGDYTSPNLSALPPADVWVPLSTDGDCFRTQQLWHIQGETLTTVPLPAPFNYPYGNVQRDPNGNVWLLITRADYTQAATPTLSFKQQAILRWNGSQWVIFTQSQG